MGVSAIVDLVRSYRDFSVRECRRNWLSARFWRRHTRHALIDTRFLHECWIKLRRDFKRQLCL
jgi:hypothetical protein